jgi:hypothetical protein
VFRLAVTPVGGLARGNLGQPAVVLGLLTVLDSLAQCPQRRERGFPCSRFHRQITRVCRLLGWI